MNIFITTQMRTGSTWLCDLIADMFNKRWQFWARGKDIPKERFQRHIDNPKGMKIFKMHHTPPKRICDCIKEGDTRNYVISITRDIKDVSISKILYMRYDSGVRNLNRLDDINKARLRFDREHLKDKDYINGFIQSPHYNHIVKNWKMYNDGFEHPNYLLLTYEDLTARPAYQMQRIYKFLDLEPLFGKVLRKIIVQNNFKQKTGRNKGDGRNSAFRRKGIVGDGDYYLTEDSLERIKRLLDE
jgi:hypothetical protein